MKKIACPKCKGKGLVIHKLAGKIVCGQCDGTGTVEVD